MIEFHKKVENNAKIEEQLYAIREKFKKGNHLENLKLVVIASVGVILIVFPLLILIKEY